MPWVDAMQETRAGLWIPMDQPRKTDSSHGESYFSLQVRERQLFAKLNISSAAVEGQTVNYHNRENYEMTGVKNKVP